MGYIEQKIFLPVKDTKTFTLIESKLCVEKKSDAGPTGGVPKRT